MSLSHNQLSKLTALREKKFRHKNSQFTVEGEKMVGELLAQSRFQVELLCATAPFLEKNEAILAALGSRVVEISEAELKKISSLTTPNQALAVCQMPADFTAPPDLFFEKTLADGWHIFLDGLQDPGNLGTIWRLADWFGLPEIICSPTTVDAWNPKVIQSSMGAFLRVAAFELDFEAILTRKPTISLLGATMDGENIFKKNDLPASGLLVIGNEGAGISNSILEKLTRRVSIPRDAAGGAESLNAAVAAGILMGVLKNQRV